MKSAVVLNMLFFFISVMDSCKIAVLRNGTSSQLVDSKVCGDHGTCQNIEGGDFKCKCDQGFTGNHCHISKSLLPPIIIDSNLYNITLALTFTRVIVLLNCSDRLGRSFDVSCLRQASILRLLHELTTL